jgi:natural product precursor
MKKLSKISLKTVSARLSDAEMRSVVGGDDYPGSGTYDDPYQLPEVTVTAPCPPDTRKDTACSGKKEWDPCDWIYNCNKYYGYCLYGNFGAGLHCSS